MMLSVVGPVIVRSSLIDSAAPPSRMLPGPVEKVIVSGPGLRFAASIASRNVVRPPPPSSARESTTYALSSMRGSRASSPTHCGPTSRAGRHFPTTSSMQTQSSLLFGDLTIAGAMDLRIHLLYAEGLRSLRWGNMHPGLSQNNCVAGGRSGMRTNQPSRPRYKTNIITSNLDFQTFFSE